MKKIYKVTEASVGKTKKGYDVFKLKLNNTVLATKFFPKRKYDREHDVLYLKYISNNSLDFLVGKYIYLNIRDYKYGFEFDIIDSYDVLQSFNNKLGASNGEAFETDLPIYGFLLDMNRNKEPDGSIKIISEFGDMRISSGGVCYQHDTSNKKLNMNNIEAIFNQYYIGVPLPAHSPGDGGDNSYYTLKSNKFAIVRMDNHVKISYKMTTSGDYDEWHSSVIIKIGQKLTDEQVLFLENANKQM